LSSRKKGIPEEMKKQRRTGAGRPVDLQLRQRVLTETMNLLMRNENLRSVTVDEIAELAQASKATIYKHWESKTVLFVEAFFDSVNERLHFSTELPKPEALRQQMLSLSRLLSSDQGAVLRKLLAESHFDPAAREALLNGFFLPRRDAARKFVASGIEDSSLRQGLEADIVVDAFYGALFYALMVGFRPLDEEWVNKVADTVLQGILPR